MRNLQITQTKETPPTNYHVRFAYQKLSATLRNVKKSKMSTNFCSLELVKSVLSLVTNPRDLSHDFGNSQRHFGVISCKTCWKKSLDFGNHLGNFGRVLGFFW